MLADEYGANSMNLGVDSSFFSTIVLFNNRSPFLESCLERMELEGPLFLETPDEALVLNSRDLRSDRRNKLIL